MDWKQLATLGIRMVASGSAATIVKNVAIHTAPKDLNRISQISLAVGSFILGGMVGDAAANYAVDQLDPILHLKEDANDNQ